ncbi:uncharacterized protein EV154DRAFT_478155 [Mucor mucedo]|uniref:uncharacterized protein n=1 Tax=Mucor mucedo TaxID=29922 RepID=UPI00221EDD20|nr:uncharacterized protein EV154DRAFT_72898 [Mucor mucedo]XP_051461175.1 uncharacterized protein EV154DRAFT_478155 [Mucor mucedo]KAI7894745.1 hypothetical protein EV154DRAFT_72898 [Mucor mucedo]KAI7894760.1 hypothetical protein EV154DRAFT_478155 [Mucor mucedo]
MGLRRHTEIDSIGPAFRLIYQVVDPCTSSDKGVERVGTQYKLDGNIAAFGLAHGENFKIILAYRRYGCRLESGTSGAAFFCVAFNVRVMAIYFSIITDPISALAVMKRWLGLMSWLSSSIISLVNSVQWRLVKYREYAPNSPMLLTVSRVGNIV